jgi:hypothetical protein
MRRRAHFGHRAISPVVRIDRLIGDLWATLVSPIQKARQ